MYAGLPFPDIDPVAVHLGPFGVRWYALAYIFGLLGAWTLARRMALRSKSMLTALKIDDFLAWIIAGVIIGGRLGYVLFYNAGYYREFPWEILYLWQGGMSFHGGLLGVAVATVLFARKYHLPVLALSDILCCVAPIGLFLGRIANFINAELAGRMTQNVPWAIIFPGEKLPRHPSQLYEAFGEGLILFLVLNYLWWFCPRYRHRTGFCTGLFLVLYGCIRFTLEFFREPDAHLGFIWHSATMGQLLSVPMVIVGLLILVQSDPKYKLNRCIKE